MIGVGLVALASAGYVPVASAEEMETVPAKVEMAHWVVAVQAPGKQLIVKGHNLLLQIRSGYCLEEPKPKVDHVKVVERPRTKQHPAKSAVLTAYVLHPEYERPVPPPNTDGIVYNACAGVGYRLEKWVKLKRPPSELRLYDGGYSPPRKVWPLP